MRTLVINNGSKNETVEITSLVQIGPERFVATTTEGFEIDLHKSHIVEELEYVILPYWFYEDRSIKSVIKACDKLEAVIKNNEYIKILNIDTCGEDYRMCWQKIRENGRGYFANLYGKKMYFNL